MSKAYTGTSVALVHGFSLALDKSDLLIVYCRSVPVEYACISPENLLDMPFLRYVNSAGSSTRVCA